MARLENKEIVGYREHGIDITTHGDAVAGREVWLVTFDEQGAIVPFDKTRPSAKVIVRPDLILCIPSGGEL